MAFCGKKPVACLLIKKKQKRCFSSMTSKGETKTQHYYKTQISLVFSASTVVLQEYHFSLIKQQERSQRRDVPGLDHACT